MKLACSAVNLAGGCADRVTSAFDSAVSTRLRPAAANSASPPAAMASHVLTCPDRALLRRDLVLFVLSSVVLLRFTAPDCSSSEHRRGAAIARCGASKKAQRRRYHALAYGRCSS